MEGTIKTFTVIRIAPEGFEEQVPYCVALVETAVGTECVRVDGYSDGTEIYVGMPVEGNGQDGHFSIAKRSDKENSA